MRGTETPVLMAGAAPLYWLNLPPAPEWDIIRALADALFEVRPDADVILTGAEPDNAPRELSDVGQWVNLAIGSSGLRRRR